MVSLREQWPSVWPVTKISLAQPRGGERVAKKATGHSAPLRKKEWSESSVRSLKDLHKPVLCLDGSPACELSALLFSLQSVVTLLQSSAPGTLDRWHQHFYPVPKRGDTYTGSLSNMGCAESRTSSSTVSVASSRLQLKKYEKSTWGLQDIQWKQSCFNLSTLALESRWGQHKCTFTPLTLMAEDASKNSQEHIHWELAKLNTEVPTKAYNKTSQK